MSIDWNEISSKSNGGTELLCRELEKRLAPELLDKFQIIPSRVLNPLDPERIRILWAHDLADDPSSNHLANGGWRRFNRIVFVSNWQAQAYIAKYSIPWSKCMVMPNAIVPIAEHEKPEDKIRLIYTSTPQRGLNILASVFDELCKTHNDIELEVFSSFNIYGWPENDKNFEGLFEHLKGNDRVQYHGAVPNDEVRETLKRSHVLAYPSTWAETSCLCLMEAMSAGLVCVHPNYGALYETGARWTLQYQWQETLEGHAGVLLNVLNETINGIRESRKPSASSVVTGLKGQLIGQKRYADFFYGWDIREREWESFLRGIEGEAKIPTEPPQSSPEQFVYRR